MSLRPPSDEYVPTGAQVIIPIQRNPNAPVTRSGGQDAQDAADRAASEAVEAERRKNEGVRQVQTVAGLQEIMAGDDFLPNELSSLHVPTYKFKLFMTDERDLFTGAPNGSLQSLYAKLDQMPQAILAETGATAGFNISNVSMEEMVSPGFQNRNTGLTNMKITLNEPNGSSFIETVAKSAQKLAISNYQNFWYFLELTFQGYTAEGETVPNAMVNANLPSGGRWIYQVCITKCEVKMNEMGSTYDLSCRPMTLNAFEDTMVGAVPDNMKVYGATIGEFMTNFGLELTRKYDERYAGRIFNFNFKNRPLTGSNASIDPNTFRLKQTENDPINTLALTDAASGGGVMAQIPMGTRISDVIDFIWVSCEDAQKVMLDTTSPENVQDGDNNNANFNGKPYRESVVPRVEADVKVTGYDPITNCYMQDITYNVYGYYTYAPNLCPAQAKHAADEEKNVGGLIAQSLKDKGYLRKKYDYRYTGLNTEVIRFDLDFNFAFSSVLPRLTGWRADTASVTDAERTAQNPDQIAGTAPTEISTNGQQNAGGRPNDAVLMDPSVSSESTASNLNQNLSLTNDAIEDAQRRLDEEKAGANDPAKVAQFERELRAAQTARYSLRDDVAAQRADYVERRSAEVAAAQQRGSFYAEDEANTKPPPQYKIRYRQAGDERASQAGGSGVLGHWHRGGSLTGALLNQLYEPVVNALVRIDLEIRGDPYWLGLSNLERRAVLNDVVNPSEVYTNLPNFSQGDNTFALTLRFPSTMDSATGEPVFRSDDVFNGLYRCNRITHTFADGQYTQKLSATKLELAMLPASSLTDNDVVITNARSSGQ